MPAAATMPTSMTDYRRIESAIRFLEDHALAQPSLEDLAAHLSLSPFHLQRLFKRWAGVSPKQFLKCLTIENARQRLAESESVLDAALDSGLSGPGRIHDLFVTIDAVTPGEFKSGGAGLRIQWGEHPTPFGHAVIGVTERGVCWLSFEDAEKGVHNLRTCWPSASITENPARTAKTVRQIFAGERGKAIPLLLKGTNFQIKVWQALLRIPPGEVCSYGDFARKALGNPNAARAAGTAIGANTIAYLIPCHRVIRSTGAVHDYRWGSVRKKAMLAREAVASLEPPA